MTVLLMSFYSLFMAPPEQIRLPNITGQDIGLEDYRADRPALLFFFASWCHLCAKEMPKVDRFAEQHPDIAVLAVSLQEKEKIVARYVKQKKIAVTIVLDKEMTLAKEFGVAGIPTMIGISADGKRIFTRHDMSDPDQIASALRP